LKLRLSYLMIRRTREQVLKELPPLTRQVVWLPADKEAEAAFVKAAVHKSPGGTAAALQATLAGKVEAALDYAEQARQFVLFTWMKSHAHQMAKILAEQRDTPCVCITGDVPHKERQALVKLAESKQWGLVATIDSLYQGVNLQGVAKVGIMHALDYVPIKMVQTEGRIHRMGQKDPVTWIYLAMKDSMDQLVVKTIVDKLDQWRATMGKDGSEGMKDTLGGNVNGAGADAEKAALRALYEGMSDL
jgi:SNF2 family DNA or RNA helicase